jgi:hypothetical protein
MIIWIFLNRLHSILFHQSPIIHAIKFSLKRILLLKIESDGDKIESRYEYETSVAGCLI